MTQSDLETAAVYARMQLLPPSLRRKLQFDSDFAQRHGIRQRVQVTLGTDGPRFDVAMLNEAIRAVFLEHQSAEVTALDAGGTWVCRAGGSPQTPVVTIAQGERALQLPLVFALHPEAVVRERGLLFGDETRLLPAERKAYWLPRLRRDALTESDMADLASDVAALPTNVANDLAAIVSAGAFEPRRLVPEDPRYYERLVGVWDHSDTIEGYAGAEFTEFAKEVSAGEPGLVLTNLTLAAAHPFISKAIACLAPDFGNRFQEQLANSEVLDLPSLVSLLEINASSPAPDLHRVTHLLDRLHVVLGGAAPECVLFASFFSLTEGELARRGLLQERPIFWRRLASMAHAAHLQRTLSSNIAEASRFEELVKQLTGECFALRTLLDLQSSPRWLPSFASAGQFRLEFLGRGVAPVKALHSSSFADDDLAAALESCESLIASDDQPFVFLPGPTEANLPARTEPSPELRKTLEERLMARPVDPTAFQMLFSASLLLRIDRKLLKLASTAIHDAVVSGENFVDVVEGELIPRLAHVAAVTRDEELAGEVRVLARVARRSSPPRGDAHQEFMTALIARAAFQEKGASLTFLADWFVELARSELSRLDAIAIHGHLIWILNFEPAYWRHLAKAEATFAAKAGYYDPQH